MRRSRRGAGARLGLAVAAALGACCLAGDPLYVSSAGSAAIQGQLAVTCPRDSALKLVVLGQPLAPFAAMGADLPWVQTPIASHSSFMTITDSANVTRRLILLSRDGVEGQVSPALSPIEDGQAAISTTGLEQLGPVHVGAHLQGVDPVGNAVSLTVTQTFDDIATEPETDYWCGFRKLLRRSPAGDPPPAMALVAPSVPVAAPRGTIDAVEFPLARREWTLHDASLLSSRFAVVYEQYRLAYSPVVGGPPNQGTSTHAPPLRELTELPVLVARAAALQHAVAISIAPARVAGVVVALIALFAAAVMFADERRRELRLLAQRGVSPWRTAVRLVPVVGVPVAIGTVLGGVVAYVAVRALGPAPALERHSIAVAFVSLVSAAVGFSLIAAFGTAVAGDRTVDRAVHGRQWRWVPFELVAVAAAIASFRRLDRGGGVRLFGTQSRGGDLLAQGLPLIAAFAGVGLLVRPAMWFARRARSSGARLPRALRLGWRRAVIGPAVFATLVGATAVACACVASAGVLDRSARRQLVDKSTTFVGADLAVTLLQPAPVPAWLQGSATVVLLFKGRIGGETIDVLGIDRATFAQVARLREDGSSLTMAQLLDRIRPLAGGPIPAVVVGSPLAGAAVDVHYSTGSLAFSVAPVAEASFFPGVSAGGRMLVVDGATLSATVANVAPSLWVRDPPENTVQRLRDEGARVRSSLTATRVFDNNDHHALGWSYAPLVALGVLFGAAALALQLLVDQARRPVRQAAHVVMERRGFSRRALWNASVVEVVVPTSLGALAGVPIGLGAASLAVRRLDPIPNVPPPPIIVLPWSNLVVLAAVLVVVDLLVATAIVRSTVRVDPMEVLRGLP